MKEAHCHYATLPYWNTLICVAVFATLVTTKTSNQNVLQYSNDGRGTETWTQKAGLKVRYDRPISSYPRCFISRRKALFDLRWLPAPVRLSANTTKGLRCGTFNFRFMLISFKWLRGKDLNLQPLGYEPSRLPLTIPRYGYMLRLPGPPWPLNELLPCPTSVWYGTVLASPYDIFYHPCKRDLRSDRMHPGVMVKPINPLYSRVGIPGF